LHHRQIGWRCTLQDPTSIDTSLLIRADPFPREPEQNEYSSLKQPSGRAVTALAKLLCLKKRDVHLAELPPRSARFFFWWKESASLHRRLIPTLTGPPRI
jgi:hypothetical protein